MTSLGREFTPRICEVFDKYEKRELFDSKMKKVIELVLKLNQERTQD